jgi:hypothetical protein
MEGVRDTITRVQNDTDGKTRSVIEDGMNGDVGLRSRTLYLRAGSNSNN